MIKRVAAAERIVAERKPAEGRAAAAGRRAAVGRAAAVRVERMRPPAPAALLVTVELRVVVEPPEMPAPQAPPVARAHRCRSVSGEIGSWSFTTSSTEARSI